MNSRYKAVFAGILAVALAFGITLPLGFWLRPRFPGMSDNVFAVIVVAMLVGIAFGVVSILRVRWLPARKRETGLRQRPDLSVTTGYEIIFDDFWRLLSDANSRRVIAPLLKVWYGYEISGDGPKIVVSSADGTAVPLRRLHSQIQHDPEKQRSIYGCAMDHWR